MMLEVRPQVMSGHVEMTREAAERGGRDRFSMSVHTWNLLREIAMTFGWLPLGTTYVGGADALNIGQRRNYEPGDARDSKSVTRDDAFAWAHALERARSSPHLIAMVEAQPGGRDAGVPAEEFVGLVGEFIAYLYGGAFTFALPQVAL